MRGNELLDKMELIDPAYIEAADRRTGLKNWAVAGETAYNSS